MLIYSLKQARWYTFLLSNLDLSLILYLLKELEKNHVSRLIAMNVLFTKVKQGLLKSEREKVFESISSDATCICHKIHFKLFLVIDIIWLLLYLNICLSYVLPTPTKSRIKWSNKYDFVWWKDKRLWGNLVSSHLANGPADWKGPFVFVSQVV